MLSVARLLQTNFEKWCDDAIVTSAGNLPEPKKHISEKAPLSVDYTAMSKKKVATEETEAVQVEEEVQVPLSTFLFLEHYFLWKEKNPSYST